MTAILTPDDSPKKKYVFRSLPHPFFGDYNRKMRIRFYILGVAGGISLRYVAAALPPGATK